MADYKCVNVGPDEWAGVRSDLGPLPNPPIVTGRTEEECQHKLAEWIQDRISKGLAPNDK